MGSIYIYIYWGVKIKYMWVPFCYCSYNNKKEEKVSMFTKLNNWMVQLSTVVYFVLNQLQKSFKLLNW